ncbi:MAG: hypothetical protein GX558_10310, partial [Clostridiales bacterium]|nr:hypothetical protein [Clostridiales bacterium]
LPELPGGLAVVDLCLLAGDGTIAYENRLLFSQKEDQPFAALQALPAARLRCARQGDGATIANEGDAAALFAHLAAPEGDDPALCDDNFLILLPGESRSVRARTAYGDACGELVLSALNTPEVRI